MGRFKKFFYVILSIIMIFINVTTIKATDFGDSFVTSFTLINEKNGEIVSDGSTIIRYQEYEAKFTFELPDGVVQPNDTLEVTLPEILQSRDFHHLIYM